MTGLLVETVCAPGAYTAAQLRRALDVAEQIEPCPLLLTEAPPHDCDIALDEHDVCVYCHRRRSA